MTLCNNHNDILYKLTLVQKAIKQGDKPLDLLKDIKAQVRLCKKQGQHMENRLRKYRTAIEDLGFTRAK